VAKEAPRIFAHGSHDTTTTTNNNQSFSVSGDSLLGVRLCGPQYDKDDRLVWKGEERRAAP